MLTKQEQALRVELKDIIHPSPKSGCGWFISLSPQEGFEPSGGRGASS